MQTKSGVRLAEPDPRAGGVSGEPAREPNAFMSKFVTKAIKEMKEVEFTQVKWKKLDKSKINNNNLSISVMFASYTLHSSLVRSLLSISC